jgi:hypothetical protein
MLTGRSPLDHDNHDSTENQMLTGRSPLDHDNHDKTEDQMLTGMSPLDHDSCDSTEDQKLHRRPISAQKCRDSVDLKITEMADRDHQPLDNTRSCDLALCRLSFTKFDFSVEFC